MPIDQRISRLGGEQRLALHFLDFFSHLRLLFLFTNHSFALDCRRLDAMEKSRRR